MQKCIKINILKIVKNQYGKESHCIIKDIEVNQQTQPEDVATISFIDSLYEEMKYKILKEQLLKDIRLDIMNLIESLSKSSKQNTDASPTDPTFQQQIIECNKKIVSLEERLASKDKSIYFLSQNISNQNTRNLSYNEKLSWLPEISVKIDKANTTNFPVSTKSGSPSKGNVEPKNKKQDGDID